MYAFQLLWRLLLPICRICLFCTKLGSSKLLIKLYEVTSNLKKMLRINLIWKTLSKIRNLRIKVWVQRLWSIEKGLVFSIRKFCAPRRSLIIQGVRRHYTSIILKGHLLPLPMPNSSSNHVFDSLSGIFPEKYFGVWIHWMITHLISSFSWNLKGFH